MIGAFDSLQKCKERCRIECAGNLTGAAADLIFYIAVNIGRGRKKTTFQSAFTDNRIV